jgi:GAF domain-containing protein
LTRARRSDLPSILPAFAAELQALQPFDRLACGFVNDTGDYIEMVSHPEGTSWGLGGVLPVVGSGPGFVALNNRPVLQKDLVHEHRYLEDMRLLEEGLRSYALFPLTSRDRAIGVLALGSARDGAFDEMTLARLQPLADAVALAFENVNRRRGARKPESAIRRTDGGGHEVRRRASGRWLPATQDHRAQGWRVASRGMRWIASRPTTSRSPSVTSTSRHSTHGP